MKLLKVFAYVLAVLLVLKLVSELLSIVFSAWFIIGAFLVWYFVIRDGEKNVL